MLLDMHTACTTRMISLSFEVLCLRYHRNLVFRVTHIISKLKHPQIIIPI